MPSNEFKTLKRKEWEREGGKRERNRERRKEEEQREERKSSFREIILMPGIVLFLLSLALTFGYCSGFRKMGLSQ